MKTMKTLVAAAACVGMCGLLGVIPARAMDAPNYTEFGGGSSANTSSGLIGGIFNFSAAGSYTYGDTISAANGGTGLTAAPSYGFYEDYEFTIGTGDVDSITSTIALANISSISNLQVRLFNAAGVASLPQVGTTPSGTLDFWSISNNSPNYTIDVLPTTMLTAGTYVLEVRGLVTGSVNGSYTGQLDVAPVPLPPALPLMLSALGALGLLGRRRALG